MNLSEQKRFNKPINGNNIMKENLVSRRHFIQTCGILGVGLTVGGAMPFAAEAAKINRTQYRVSRSKPAMGTIVTMTVIHESRDLADEAIGLAFNEIEKLSAVFDRYKSFTPVSALNSNGRIVGPPPELKEVLGHAINYNRLTGSAFDVTVAPVVDLFKRKSSAGQKLEMSGKEFSDAVNLVGSDGIEISSNAISLKRSGMGVTLDGIAKGYIVDRASDLLAGQGAVNHLLNAGGDIRTMGQRSENRPWKIAIEDPAKKGNYPDIITMRDGAVATSGGYEVYFDSEKMFHHVITPSTGRSPIMAKSVSVKAPTVMEADILSTSVFVMHPKNGVGMINSLPGRECLIVADSGAQISSRKWGKLC